jgi:hypothetical protein
MAPNPLSNLFDGLPPIMRENIEKSLAYARKLSAQSGSETSFLQQPPDFSGSLRLSSLALHLEMTSRNRRIGI